jgi:HD superfamily phosphohydrolase
VFQTSFSSAHIGSDDLRAYDFSKPMDLNSWGLEDSFFPEIISTEAFQRLQYIRFLGGIDYALVQNPNGVWGNTRYTRYQHSLGVARLSLMYSRGCELTDRERRLIFAAALLHDVGHAPLSHSLEPVFHEAFGIEHHQATRDIIAGRAPIGRSLSEVLRRYGVDVDRVTALISGEDPSFNQFFSGPINFDTVEGILRTRTYIKPATSPLAPELAAVNRSTPADQEIVDQFWLYKDQIYTHVINSRTGILADSACQLFMKRHMADIGKEDYFSTEEAVFKKMPGLRNLLKSRNFENLVASDTITVTMRRFFIDRRNSFFERDDKKRYLQARTSAKLEVELQEAQNAQHTGDLFGDRGN